MKALMRWATLLYPAAWRERYGAEFEALLDDVGPSGGDLWNIVRGALAMQLTTGRFWKILAACAVAGALIAGVWSLTMQDRYVSTAVMRISGDGTAQMRQMKLQQLQQEVLSRKSLSDMIVRSGLYKSERTKQPLEDIIQQMRDHDVRINSVDSAHGRAFTIQFASDNPAGAQAAVREFVAAFTEQNVQLRDAPVNLEVLDPASLPSAPSGPNRVSIILTGLIAGLVLGLAAGAIWFTVRRQVPWSLRRIGIFAAAGMTLGLTVAFLIPDEYVSTAVLLAPEGADVHKAAGPVLSDASLGAIIRREGLYTREVNRGGIAEIVRKMRGEAIRIQAVTGSLVKRGPAFTISFRYHDRVATQLVTRDLVSGITAGLPGAEILDAPSLPLIPNSPRRAPIAFFGAFVGILLGLVATRFRRPATVAA